MLSLHLLQHVETLIMNPHQNRFLVLTSAISATSPSSVLSIKHATFAPTLVRSLTLATFLAAISVSHDLTS